MNSFVGTSGYQYPAWRGTFYPEKLATAKMLSFYADQFPTTEVNYSFHRIPSPKTIESWYQSTPDGFRFGLKAPQKITHWAKLKDCADNLNYFLGVIADLDTKLGPILFQLPPTLKMDLALLTDFLAPFPESILGAFEFRHESWFDDNIFALLKKHNVSLCINESSDFAAPHIATANFGYLRLRREDYQEADIDRWAKFVQVQQDQWKQTFIYFKHEESGIGPKLAKQMIERLARP
jgi:uncharacterized protein YecE (DUF72 family)